jgi:hypothetical protein
VDWMAGGSIGWPEGGLDGWRFYWMAGGWTGLQRMSGGCSGCQKSGIVSSMVLFTLTDCTANAL